MRVARLGASLSVGLLTLAAAAEGPVLDQGIHLKPSRVALHRGERMTIRARLDPGEGNGIQGRWPVWWMVRDAAGRCLIVGRRVVHFGWDEDYGFTVRARLPTRGDGATRLDVLVMDWEEDDEDMGGLRIYERGAIPLEVIEGRSRPARAAETVTGTLHASGWNDASPVLVPDGADYGGGWSFAWYLLGEGVSDVLRNPFWDGARVTVEGREVIEYAYAYFPEGPFPLRVDRVTWENPVPETLGLSGGMACGVMPARIPPRELLGELSWRSLLEASRQPRAIETQEGMDALRDEIAAATGGTAPYWPMAVDFAESRVVAVFAGVSPDASWRVQLLDIHHDAATEVTRVRYAVVGPRRGRGRGERWVEPWEVAVIPRRPGSVEFVREEFLPDRPAWW